MTITAHDTHVAGGKARWAPPADWRARYGETARNQRKVLVDAARARLTTSIPFETPAGAPDQRSVNAEHRPGEEVTHATPRGTPMPRRARDEGGRTKAIKEHGSAGRAASLNSPAVATARTDHRQQRSAESIARDDFIVQMHGVATTKQLARELGISREAVVVRRQRLANRGLIEIKRTGRRNTWSPGDDRYFRENIGHVPLEEIAAHLKRKPRSENFKDNPADLTRVGWDEVDGAEISTVFLGLDHGFGLGPPLWFETMIFGGDHGGFCRRYTTWDEAAAGHTDVVAALRAGRSPDRKEEPA